jgi:two-component system phosphate regulon sensor histidine kinase PhoR
MSEGVMLINAAGRVLLMNPALRRTLRAVDWVVGQQYLEVVRHPGVAAQVGAALAGTTPATTELSLDTTPPRWVAVSAIPVPVERGGGALLVLHDITELRHADQVRRDFVANVSHELRTPLTAIRGYLEALMDEGPVSQPAREFLEIIARHASRMERLVRDLLRLARLDAGQEPLERARCSLAAIAAAIEVELAPVLTARRQRLVVGVDADAATVQADPAKLHDALRNLLENASNYSPEATDIDVSTRRTDTSIEIDIADRGPGIPPGDLPRIFERFYRVDRSRSRDPGGTGLGLSIVRHLIELHGGHVSASNRPGGGALFRVTLPG